MIWSVNGVGLQIYIFLLLLLVVCDLNKLHALSLAIEKNTLPRYFSSNVALDLCPGAGVMHSELECAHAPCIQQ